MVTKKSTVKSVLYDLPVEHWNRGHKRHVVT